MVFSKVELVYGYVFHINDIPDIKNFYKKEKDKGVDFLEFLEDNLSVPKKNIFHWKGCTDMEDNFVLGIKIDEIENNKRNFDFYTLFKDEDIISIDNTKYILEKENYRSFDKIILKNFKSIYDNLIEFDDIQNKITQIKYDINNTYKKKFEKLRQKYLLSYDYDKDPIVVAVPNDCGCCT